jgi:hypothetical protein
MWSLYGEHGAVVPHLQRTLSAAIELAIFKRSPLLPPLAVRDLDIDDENDKSASPSSLWLTAAPTSADTNLTSQAFTSAIRHRYALPCRADLPARCVCDAMLQGPGSAAHFHVCPSLRRTGVTHRHDLIVRHMVNVCKRLGLVASIEPALRNAAGQRTRPDFSFVTHTGVVFVDVSICCPFAASPDSITAREKQKVDKYADSAFLVGAAFRPFVLSSVGEMGNGARDVIQLIVSEHHHGTHAIQPHLSHSIMTSVSVQLQAGNGLVDVSGIAALSAVRRAPPPRVPLHPEQLLRLQQQRATSNKPRYNHFQNGLRRQPTSAADMPCCNIASPSSSSSSSSASSPSASAASYDPASLGDSKRMRPPSPLPEQHARAHDSSVVSSVPPGLSLHHTTTSIARDMQGDREAHTGEVAHSSMLGGS